MIGQLSQYIRKVQPTRCNVSQFLYFCKTLYMFQTVFPSIVRSSKLHIQHQVFAEHLTEINKLRNAAFCWFYSANILAMLGPMNVKSC